MLPEVNIYNDDCIRGMSVYIPDNSIDLIVTSIPFEELFAYSNQIEDVSNNGSTNDIRAGRFALNMRFVVRQMYRVLKQGCNACIHIQQLLAFKCQHGFMGRRDFRGSMIDVFGVGGEVRTHAATEDGDLTPVLLPRINLAGEGFDCIGEFAVAKDPQIMAARLNLHSLQFKTGYSRTSTNLAPAPNDFVMVFQKPGDTPNPVRSIRHDKNPGGWLPQDEWIRDACGIWTDIRMMDVLDVVNTKEGSTEKHVCALQLDLIRRLVRLYTNPIEIQPDVTVLDPFMGIGSTAYVCLCGPSNDRKIRPLESPRNVVGFELKKSYHAAALANIAAARKLLEDQDGHQVMLWDLTRDALETSEAIN